MEYSELLFLTWPCAPNNVVHTICRSPCGFDSRLLLGPVIPKTLKMGVVPACMVLTMKKGPRNITGWPGVSIM